MMQFNEWLFEINIPKGKDAHYALVHWLKRNSLGDLFTEESKAITYVVYQYMDGYCIIAKSCVPIHLPIVEHNSFEVDLKSKIKLAVQLSTKKRVRPPNLLHESQSSSRHQTIIRGMTDVEKNERVQLIIQELGIDPNTAIFTTHEGIDIPVHHKRQNLFISEPTMNVVIEGNIVDALQFEKAWSYGVGNKRVYGLGCVRILR